ncbi:MAG: NAD-dependent epimerase/dehydratase family protein, partial [Gaiellaceae bacterium]
IRQLGAEAVVLDALAPREVRLAVLEAEPDAIVHQATALADVNFSRNLDRSFERTNGLRTEGTDALLDPLDPAPLEGMRETIAALNYLEQAMTEAGGIGLRYGGFYGAHNDALVEPVRKRRFPIVGDGGGFSSFIHLDDAAAATVLALEHEGPAIYNIVDDEPAPVREWLPVLADVLGAKPPRHVPIWLAKMLAGEVAVMLGTEARGASNARVKRELGWTPRYPSWRQGFVEAYAKPAEQTEVLRPAEGFSH